MDNQVERAVATIVDIEHRGGSLGLTYEFTTKQGEVIHEKGILTSKLYVKEKIGSTVMVRYNPDNPRSFSVENRLDSSKAGFNKTIIIVPIVFGLILACVILTSVLLSGCSMVKSVAKRATNKVTSKLTAVMSEKAMDSYKKDTESRLGDIELPDDVIIEEKDDFIPMVPDGYQKITVTLPEGYDFASYLDDTWMPYPMQENAIRIVDGYQEGDSHYGTRTDDFIPSDIEHGYYRFITYVHDVGWKACKTDASIKKDFIDDNAQTYTVIAYDSDAGKIYTYYLSW